MPAPEGDGALAGQTLGPYRMERQLGRGGMGVVYLAEDTRLGRKVAVKILPKEFSADDARKDRLRLEARAAAALSHPAIATVFSLEELDGRLCLVSEYVRGDTLRAELDHGPFSLDLLIDTGIQVARGLAAAHAAGVIHRDLKPDNIIRSIQGEVKILDFGIAHLDTPGAGSSPRLTAVGQAIGTPGYMSPEQLDGAEIDPRSDVFALGVLLYELATGAHPFTGPTPAATIANVYAANPPQLQRARRTAAAAARCDRAEVRAAKPGRALQLGARRRARPAGSARRPPARAVRGRPDAGAVEPALVVAGPPAVRDPGRERSRLRGLARAHGGPAGLDPRAVPRLHRHRRRQRHAARSTCCSRARSTSPTCASNSAARCRSCAGRISSSQLLLLIPAAAMLRPDTLLSATLAAFGVGWAVVSLMVEPATRAAAFRSAPDPTPHRDASPD